MGWKRPTSIDVWKLRSSERTAESVPQRRCSSCLWGKAIWSGASSIFHIGWKLVGRETVWVKGDYSSLIPFLLPDHFTWFLGMFSLQRSHELQHWTEPQDPQQRQRATSDVTHSVIVGRVPALGVASAAALGSAVVGGTLTAGAIATSWPGGCWLWGGKLPIGNYRDYNTLIHPI